MARLRVRRSAVGLPPRLRRRLDASADAWIRAGGPDASPADPPPVPRVTGARSRAGWYAAAACFLVAVAGWWPRLEPAGRDVLHGMSPLGPKAEKDRQHLLDRAGPHLGRWSWVHESGLPAPVEGEVVWDGDRQEGYLTLEGLAPNAQSGRQYQLWIFDASRDDRYPVDGGVFDVPGADVSVTVPIRPALHVSHPVAFAVTLEPAGGVVVSDRSHLMAMARASPR